MKIALTGSNGTLGKEMIKILEKSNINYESIKCRYDSLNSISEQILNSDFSFIFHFGALKPNSISSNFNEKEFYKENVLSTIKLAQIAFKKNIKFIFISTADIYPKRGGPFEENDILDVKKNLIIGGQYGISKYLAENEITNLPVNYIIFRSSTIYKEEEVVEATFAKEALKSNQLFNFEIRQPNLLLNLVRADFLCQDILRIVISNSFNRTSFNYTSSFWTSPMQILKTISNHYQLPFSYDDLESKVVQRKFNGSNKFIKSSLLNHYKESNYLSDLNSWLIKNSSNWYNKKGENY